jgi:hypothetical protein
MEGGGMTTRVYYYVTIFQETKKEIEKGIRYFKDNILQLLIEDIRLRTGTRTKTEVWKSKEKKESSRPPSGRCSVYRRIS